MVPPVDAAWIEADLLSPLIRGRDTGRYCFDTEGWYQLIPNAHYENVETEEAFADRYPLTYSYLKNYENLLRHRASYKRYQAHLPFYVVYCVGDYSFSPYKVVWMEQQDPSSFRSVVVSSLDTCEGQQGLIIPDHKLYFAALDSADEAHFLCGFLNSAPVRTWLGGFLLGKQIGTTIFEYMKVPAYDARNDDCAAISAISKGAHRARIKTRETKLLDDQAEHVLARHVQAICTD
jgi:hypothetical protein